MIGALVVWLGYEFLTFPNIAKLKTDNPTTTSMIEYRAADARQDGKEPKRQQIWISVNKISPNLQRAVLAGEDTNFLAHNGFDWDAIEKSWEAAQKEAAPKAGKKGGRKS